MKKILYLLLLTGSLFAGETNFNINLSIPPATTMPKTLPTYKTLLQTYNKNQYVQQKKINKQNTQKTLKIKNNYIQAGNVKIVSSNVIKNINPLNPGENICNAFIADNSNNAFDYGYKEGVKYTKLYVGKFLLKHKKELDILFPLKQLYLDNGILQPPLIGEKNDGSFIYNNGNVYRQYGVEYYIKHPAVFVTKNSYKKWEDFLLDYDISYYKKTPISNVLKFKISIKYSNNPLCNKEIRKKVYENFVKGFKAGEKEVFLLMYARLKKLQDFLNGLYLYNDLYYRGIINPPLISEFIEPVYKNNNGQELIINEKVLKIVKPASFNTQTKKWKVFLITNDKITTIHLNIKH